MFEWFQSIDGVALALLGAAIAFVFPATAGGVAGRMVAEGANGVLAEDPNKFGQTLTLQAITTTATIYGIIISFITLNSIGVFAGEIVELSTTTGAHFFLGAIPIAVAGTTTSLSQGRAAAAGVSLIAKRPEALGKAIAHAVMIEIFQIFGLLLSFMIIFNISV